MAHNEKQGTEPDFSFYDRYVPTRQRRDFEKAVHERVTPILKQFIKSYSIIGDRSTAETTIVLMLIAANALMNMAASLTANADELSGSGGLLIKQFVREAERGAIRELFKQHEDAIKDGL